MSSESHTSAHANLLRIRTTDLDIDREFEFFDFFSFLKFNEFYDFFGLKKFVLLQITDV